MIYLTGASSSVLLGEAPQTDPMKSLGGYISSSPVPNGATNELFDLISIRSLKERITNTIAIGLVNKFDTAVNDVKLKMVCAQDAICDFRVAAVTVDKNLCMEHINNRFAEPVNAEFYDATFYRGSVDVEIIEPGIIGEEIVFDPFNITATVERSGYEGTFEAVNKAFSKSNNYSVKKLTEKTFRIESKDEETINEPFDCSFIATEKAKFKFNDKFRNIRNNEVFLVDELQPNEAIGIWIQRKISDTAERSNAELIDDYDNKRTVDTLEEPELIINYNIEEPENEGEE